MKGKKSNVVDNIRRMEQDRDDRKKKFEEEKWLKEQRKVANKAAGKNIDVEFDMMIDRERKKH